ncbi:RNA polymerase sigma factor [Klebsormidium nitens]|uniref:RNA polymerase sigma factor n=1 Tax=Klebsormidium nitens TaxID=105231 RepID=A0A1Y1IF99_KLENI|nr:RNA polymerase sigma factor [Klebsormidium nitens]|eukprot:GAQ88692.1 RNA polymerase sigma factor [Klebsormidium nitens]
MASLISCKGTLVRSNTFLGAGLGQGPQGLANAKESFLPIPCVQARGTQEVVTSPPTVLCVKSVASNAGSTLKAKRGDRVTARVVAAGTSAVASTLDLAELDMLELKRTLLETQWALPSVEEDEGLLPSTSGREFEAQEEAQEEAPCTEAGAREARARVKKPAKPVQPRIRPSSSNMSGPARRRRLQTRKERFTAQGDPVPEFSGVRSSSSEAARRAAAVAQQRAEAGLDESLSLFEECLNTHQLLTPEEEKHLCKKVYIGQQLQAAKERLEHALEREATLEEWAVHVELADDMGELVRRVRHAESAKEKLVVSNLRLVISVAKNYASFGLPLVDLIQEGTLGLMRGIERFEYKRGYKLSTYTHWWIRQACTRAIADSSRTIKMPVHMHEAISRIRRLIRESGKTSKDLTPEYIAQELKIPQVKVKSCLVAMSQRMFSWDASMGSRFPDSDAREWTFGSMVHDPSPEANPRLEAENRFKEKEVHRLLGCLDSRERDIVNHGFGLGEYEGTGLAFEILGHKYGCTRERVRQIQAGALQKLSARAAKVGMHDFANHLTV